LEFTVLTITPFEQNLFEMLAPAAADLGFEIVRVRMMGRDTKTLQIMAERADGSMSSGDCEKLSRGISPILDANDPITGEYHLEISSPGIDRPLTRPKDFVRWAGYRAKLELDRMVEGQKRFTGTLVGLEGEYISVDLDNEAETALIPFAWLHNAKLVLTDELIRESLNRREKNDESELIENALDKGDIEIETLTNNEETAGE
jgi:ribosome maturation factor RimP